MTQTPGEPISDGDAPTGDPDLAPGEQPEPATEPGVSDDHSSDQAPEVGPGDAAEDPKDEGDDPA